MDIFVARQPIVDRQGGIVGYELLYRRSGSSRAGEA
jgi:c-di-GMP-related signal transduction protein